VAYGDAGEGLAHLSLRIGGKGIQSAWYRSTVFKELAIMDTDRKLGEVAADLDDMPDSIEELKDAAHEGDSPSEGALDDLQQHVEHASDAIDEVVDPERARKY
jgi:hypothetical protein